MEKLPDKSIIQLLGECICTVTKLCLIVMGCATVGMVAAVAYAALQRYLLQVETLPIQYLIPATIIFLVVTASCLALVNFFLMLRINKKYENKGTKAGRATGTWFNLP